MGTTLRHGLLAIGCLAGLTMHAACQDTSSSAALLKRRVIAEAVSTYRDSGTFFLVGARSYPFTVVGAYASREEADRVARAAGRMFEVSGPHTARPRPTPWQVLSVTVRIRGADGREQTLEYDPRTVDAVFLTMPAVEKFMAPYYTRLYGRGYVDTLIAELEQPPPKPPCHRYSIPCWPPGRPIMLPHGVAVPDSLTSVRNPR